MCSKTGEDNKLTREAQIRQLYKEESTYDRLLTLEKAALRPRL